MTDVLFSKFGVAVNNVRNPRFAGGAYGDGSHDDHDAIQAAIDDSFGTAASPHGTSSWLNKPLYFPHGNYHISSPLVLTQVLGGYIFGDGPLTTQISQTSSNTSAIVTNGFKGCRIERLSIGGNGTGVGIDFDWNGTGDVGLSGNSLAHATTSGGYGARIGNSGNEGVGHRFDGVLFGGTVGLGVMTAGAINNVVIGGDFQSCTNVGMKIVHGGVSLFNSVGLQQPSGVYDIQVDDAAHPLVAVACRSESENFLDMNATGTVVCLGCTQTGGVKFLDISAAGKVILDACAAPTGIINGSVGTVYVRGGTFISSYLDTFSGTSHVS